MTIELTLPRIAVDGDARPQPNVTLGAARKIESRMSVGRSDVLQVTAGEVTDDRALREYLRRRKDEIALIRVAFQMSFRPAPGEHFETALLSVLLSTDVPEDTEHPFVRALAPDRLASGPFTAERGITVGLAAGLPGFEAGAERSTKTTAVVTRPYVVAAGLGERDPEWRYFRTETTDLDGSHSMGMVVEARRDVPLVVSISVHATVVRGRHRVEVTWEPPPHIARVGIPPASQ